MVPYTPTRISLNSVKGMKVGSSCCLWKECWTHDTKHRVSPLHSAFGKKYIRLRWTGTLFVFHLDPLDRDAQLLEWAFRYSFTQVQIALVTKKKPKSELNLTIKICTVLCYVRCMLRIREH